MTSITTRLDQILTQLDIQPVLFDVGASGGYHEIWKPIAPHSVYVGFDPDQREMRELPDSLFKRAIIVNKAVTSDPDSDQLEFMLTRFPQCSSTLPPDSAELENYLFADLFIVEDKVSVPATTLAAVLDQLDMARIDWIKTDTQGIDLRIFSALPQSVRDHVLALDVEPGFISAYLGEDTWVATHTTLTSQGFWLSAMNVRGSIRIRQSSLQKLAQMGHHYSDADLLKRVPVSPGWAESCYLRRLDWMAAHDYTDRDYALLWVVALIQGQKGFALDVVLAFRERFDQEAVSLAMLQHTLALLAKPLPPAWLTALRDMNLLLKLYRLRKRLLGR